MLVVWVLTDPNDCYSDFFNGFFIGDEKGVIEMMDDTCSQGGAFDLLKQLEHILETDNLM